MNSLSPAKLSHPDPSPYAHFSLRRTPFVWTALATCTLAPVHVTAVDPTSIAADFDSCVIKSCREDWDVAPNEATNCGILKRENSVEYFIL